MYVIGWSNYLQTNIAVTQIAQDASRGADALAARARTLARTGASGGYVEPALSSALSSPF